jgi:hypothetical protein
MYSGRDIARKFQPHRLRSGSYMLRGKYRAGHMSRQVIYYQRNNCCRRFEEKTATIVLSEIISSTHLVDNNVPQARTMFRISTRRTRNATSRCLRRIRTLGLECRSRFIDPCRPYSNTYIVRHNNHPPAARQSYKHETPP